MNKKGKNSKGILSQLLTTAAMPLLIVVMIIVILASFVYAVFHGLVEIIETVLDQILDFVTDTIGRIREIIRNFHNSWIIAFRRG